MEQKNRKIVIAVIIAIIIVAGIIMVAVKGFNKELRYQDSQKIDVYVGQQIDRDKVKNIANEVLGKGNIVETIEIYQDMVTIRARNITEEQKVTIVNKLKENYEFEQTAENTTIEVVPATRIIDMYKQYIIPFVISGILILVYMLIRYYKKEILKVLANTVTIPIISEVVLLSLVAITRIPLGSYVSILVLLVYVISILVVVRKNEDL